MKQTLVKISFITVASVFSLSSYAQLKAGEVDASYKPVFDGNVLSMVLEPDGKSVCAGSFYNVGDRKICGLIRLKANGDEDESFNKGGKGFDSYATAVAKTSDGKYLVAGHFTTYNEKAVGSLVRINADGTLDETFKNDIKFEIVNHKNIKEIELQQIVMLPNGQFYVAGCFNRVNGKLAPLIARFNADGTRDESFLPTDKEIHLKSSPNVDAIWKAPDGSLYLGGSFGGYDGGFKQKRLIHINADGTLDRSFHQPQLDGFVKSISPFGEDKILVGGDFLTTESGDRFLTCVINKDGSLDESYNPRQNFFTENHDAESLAVFGSKLVGDNVIIVGGDVVTPGNAFFHVLTKDGKDFSSTLKIEGQPNKIVSFLKIDDSEKYAYISGFFTKVGDYVLPYFARVALRDIVPDGINATNINKVEPSVRYNNGMLTVNGIEGNAELSVYSTKGTAITLCNVSNALPIALPLPKGIYIVQIKNANGKTYTSKIIN
ncbi:T9SS type A sorting domain-containing protein [Prevotella pallens]|uniref:T9SS type A sorting domain-containing protein n=1 Tax=Prevotella pallens TaxID=60133 RepID=UPI0023F87194|nr:T9SS type A sorting domain-containing protein [Prevotella pallens]